ncbi:hypothetical protein CORC01_10334 [Colletotrichum orchidophilum]|uniref:Uncharacterized protein n=1 Tax=Colletotrichum orchidophilum TaxID=1209926 RepID=A0A1G4AZ55_9PEZI|nr:uncharacterized protein CORC01_10334 [Colletotrichum orchidophilum]OHE94406.1 hypothetical protein CORC01_10334 [Colletotrichum orchidophilum]
MKSHLLLPAALLSLAGAATIPESANPNTANPIVVPDSVLDAAIREPLQNFVAGPVRGSDPAQLLPVGATEPSEAEEYALAAAGQVAWAAIELEASDALGGLASSSAEQESLSEARAAAVNAIAKNVDASSAAAADDPPRREPNDFHLGITKDQLCEYYKGIAWKTGNLQRPVYQWQYEYVPWLIYNKGPYIFVLDGLRHIEWILWKIERALINTTAFTPEEEFEILSCYYDYSGRETQITRVPTGAPALPQNTTGPSPSLLPRDLVDPVTTATITIQPPQPTDLPPINRPGHRGASWPHIPWRREHPSLKKLLRLITAKAPVSKYQSYANHRIHNVLRQLEQTTLASAVALRDKFQDPSIQVFLDYDIAPGQGIRRAFEVAVEAYEVK